MNISVCGKVSVGKSGFINSFFGTFTELILGKLTFVPISSMSLQRETFQPQEFNFVKNNFSVTLKTKENREIRNSSTPTEFTFEKIEVGPVNDFISSIIDFPGFDDSNDKRDTGALIKSKMGDVTIFVIDATRPLIDQSECNYLAEFCNRSQQLNGAGTFNQLIIVINKFDHLDDDDLNEMFTLIQKNETIIKYKPIIFRWCSYAYFKHFNLRGSQGATAPCDIDKLLLFLMSKDIVTLKKNAAEKFLVNELKTKSFDSLVLIATPKTIDAVIENYFKFKFKRELPDEFFDEEIIVKHKILSEKHMIPILNKVKNLKPYFVEIGMFFVHINNPDPLFQNLKQWATYKFLDLRESYGQWQGLKTMLKIPSFPIGAIEYFNINKRVLLYAMDEHKLSNVDFWSFYYSHTMKLGDKHVSIPLKLIKNFAKVVYIFSNATKKTIKFKETNESKESNKLHIMPIAFDILTIECDVGDTIYAWF